jgi:glycosyltransferase involved in cell wall biosynthesis
MVSFFTPSHKTTFLTELYQSLLTQTDPQWEWVILLNNGATNPQFIDPRVKVFTYENPTNKVGELKAEAVKHCTGDILAELDHDDLLTADCVRELTKCFKDTIADFVYSNFAEVDQDWKPLTWSEYWGWKFRDFNYQGHQILEAVSPEPYPSNLARIWYAPNHIRAWRKDFYSKLGGYDPSMMISDDHDIICRTYLRGKMVHLDRCLYIYRVHGDNTWLKLQQEIQTTMWQNYDRYIYPMVEKWATDNGVRKIDLCGGHSKPEGYESIDLRNADITADLNNDWPLEDNSVGVLRAHDAIEHLKDPIHTMNEAWRVLRHGGFMMIIVPSTDGAGAWCDPTHVSFWNKRSFRYYTEAGMRKYLEPACRCRFQVMKLENAVMWDNVPYVQAHLIALKDGPRFHGECLI